MHPLIHNVAKPLLVAVAAILVGHCGVAGCASTKPPTPTEAEYLGDRLACIQIYQTRDDAQNCLDDVDRRFGVSVDARPSNHDSGAEASFANRPADAGVE